MRPPPKADGADDDEVVDDDEEFRRKFLEAASKSDGEAAVENDEESQEDHQYELKNDVVTSRTLDWIKKVVIGYNLCPFAKTPLSEGRLKVSVVRGDDDEKVAGAVAYELIARSAEHNVGTSVVVAPEYHPTDFEGYMSLVHFLEDDFMDENDLHGIVQIAPFHPLFEFEGSEEGVDNYTNRAPYPMFHVLREVEVGAAVKRLGGESSKVWSRNVALLESMEERWGRDGVERAMRGEEVDGVRELMRDVRLRGYSDHDGDAQSER